MKNTGFLKSLKHAAEGFITAVKNERNMKIHLCAALLVLIFGIMLHISTLEWLVCIGWIAAVISAEMVNTAIEITVDLAMPEINIYAKKAKDVAAGSVLVLAVGAAVSGAIIFLPKLAAFVLG